MHGGKRQGSGRPPGSKTQRMAELALAAAGGGMTPIEYMLGVMRDDGNELSVRLDAAKAAAPYVHPKLAAVDLAGDVTVSINWPLPKPKIEE